MVNMVILYIFSNMNQYTEYFNYDQQHLVNWLKKLQKKLKNVLLMLTSLKFFFWFMQNLFEFNVNTEFTQINEFIEVGQT
jgi:hypothetical protein